MDQPSCNRFPCPCCGHIVFAEPPGSFDICPICWWEDDNVQPCELDFGGGANWPSLAEAQENYRRIGASHPRLRARTSPTGWEPLDSEWRPFDRSLDVIEGDVSADVSDGTAYYDWRRRR